MLIKRSARAGTERRRAGAGGGRPRGRRVSPSGGGRRVGVAGHVAPADGHVAGGEFAALAPLHSSTSAPDRSTAARTRCSATSWRRWCSGSD
ncbi:hypothetical protein AB5I41_08470 [Sphingomonas sp. MMS24-JH45]